MNEDTLIFGSNNNLVGITCEPKNINTNLPIVLLLNPGAVQRVGLGRMNVELARELAQNGFISLRFDFTSLGDSQKVNDNDIISADNFVKDCKEAMNNLQEMHGVNSFIIFGFCGGGNIGLLIALEDSRIEQLIIVNGIIKEKFYFENVFIPLAKKRISQKYYEKKLFKLGSWKKVLTGKSNLFTKEKFIRLFSSFIKKKNGNKENSRHNNINTINSLKEKISLKNEKVAIKEEIKSKSLPSEIELIEPYIKLKEKNIKMYFIFSEGSEIYQVYKMTLQKEFKKLLNENIVFLYLKNIDHTFTLYWARKHLLKLILIWLKKHYEFSEA